MPHMDDSEGGQHVALGSENRHILPLLLLCSYVAIASVLTTDCSRRVGCPLNRPTLFHSHYIFVMKCYYVITSLLTGCDWRTAATAARTAATERILERINGLSENSESWVGSCILAHHNVKGSCQS